MSISPTVVVEGASAIIFCNATLSVTPDSLWIAKIDWRLNHNVTITDNIDYDISPIILLDSITYSSSVWIETVKQEDNGLEFICTFTINGSSYIEGSEQSSSALFTIDGKFTKECND